MYDSTDIKMISNTIYCTLVLFILVCVVYACRPTYQGPVHVIIENVLMYIRECFGPGSCIKGDIVIDLMKREIKIDALEPCSVVRGPV